MVSVFLASIADQVLYVSPIKVGVVAVLSVAWAVAAQWVDRDTDVVKTRREQWNLIVISGAFVGFLVLFAVPFWGGSLFAVGLGFWVLLAGGALVAYLVHRNGRVVPARRVLTVGYFKRKILGDPNKKQAAKDTGQRVRLADHEGNTVKFPEDPDEADAYNATQEFLYDLLWRRASDMEMLAGKERYRVVYRIDGVPTERPDGLSLEDGERIFRYVKRLAGLNPEEIRRPQTGRIQLGLLSQSASTGFSEVRTSGTTAGERLRIQFQSGAVLLRLHELGMAPQRLEVMTKAILGKPTGLFLISSTPHNGLTTTQYAVLRSHDAYMHNIHALERRPLLELDNITQQLFEGANTDVNYARMLQTVLRREPDIIMVSECEDRETAQIAVRAAAEDRKIYLGIHATSTLDALAKFVNYVGDNQLVAGALVGVMNQRLVRILCETCREAYEPDAATLKKLNLPADKIDRFYRPPAEPKRDRKGNEIPCPDCQGSGYQGRVGVFELMVVDDTIRTLIATSTPASKIKAACRKNRMYYLQEEGLLRVIDGTTSMNEVLRSLRGDGK
ncbi:MAG: Flp pilus assembly complex ATPase component TadA [Planctomycetes bacterium]|nr:Flp pilus assembly complex ATPase component TadA [Planctomycetota bacterium]